MTAKREALPDRSEPHDRWTLEPNAGGHLSLIMVAGRIPRGTIEVVPAAEADRLRAENERLRKQLRREQIIASALANISHVIDEKQSGADVIHTEDCPACAASQRIDAALARASDDIQAGGS